MKGKPICSHPPTPWDSGQIMGGGGGGGFTQYNHSFYPRLAFSKCLDKTSLASSLTTVGSLPTDPFSAKIFFAHKFFGELDVYC